VILRDASYLIETPINAEKILKNIERIGRVCYKSEKNITDLSCNKFIALLINRGHEAILEHESITVRVICDRGMSHEIVRHRIASYAQESSRYCKYNELCFIRPSFWTDNMIEFKIWKTVMRFVEKIYFKLLQYDVSPEQARCILPNSLKTEIVMTMNLREWRHFFKLRTDIRAHPQMRDLFKKLLCEFRFQLPVVFDDI
jgi:thymidylate synthase (FAD)